jgi:PLP dependent protein
MLARHRSPFIYYFCMLATKYLRAITTGAFIPRFTYCSLSKANRNQPQLQSQNVFVAVPSGVTSTQLHLLKRFHPEFSHPLSALNAKYVLSTVQRKMSSSTENNVDATELVDVGVRYHQVLDRVHAAASQAGREDVRLVAVSKTKPISLLEAAYNVGCRHFGENYVQELIEKVALWQQKTDVQWHFIGALQSNKCQMLVNSCNDIAQLTVETISSIKLATKLNNAVGNKIASSSCNDAATSSMQQRLKVFVQVNTSGEDSKSGVEPGEACIEMCRYIVNECPLLELRGLMTIGAPGDTTCFVTLVQCRDSVLSELGKIAVSDETGSTTTNTPPTYLELSMGMSDDFEQAIQAGSTNVRVGSTIFGHRNYST